MAGLSTHVLDLTHGRPAAGVRLRVGRSGAAAVAAETNADGRAQLIAAEALEPGAYRLEYEVGAYFRSAGLALGQPMLFETVVIEIQVAEAGQSLHVPLLVSPFGYSTYRGS
jgi:5-hydroxyisourate hydrolase